MSLDMDIWGLHGAWGPSSANDLRKKDGIKSGCGGVYGLVYGNHAELYANANALLPVAEPT